MAEVLEAGDAKEPEDAEFVSKDGEEGGEEGREGYLFIIKIRIKLFAHLDLKSESG